MILFLAGGTLGVLLAYASVPALLKLTPSTYTVFQDVSVDMRVLAAMLVLAGASGLLFGLAPALSLSRRELVDAFKEDGTRTTSTRRSAWLRKTLAVVEVALCMLLLIGAGLLIQTFAKMRAVDPGFDVRGVLTARMSMQGDRYATRDDINRFFERGLDQIRRIGGVQSAAVVNGVPIARASEPECRRPRWAAIDRAGRRRLAICERELLRDACGSPSWPAVLSGKRTPRALRRLPS